MKPLFILLAFSVIGTTLFNWLRVEPLHSEVCTAERIAPFNHRPSTSSAQRVEEFTFQPTIDHARLLVPVTIEHTTYNFLLDTGFAHTVLDSQFTPMLKSTGTKAKLNAKTECDVFESPRMTLGSSNLSLPRPIICLNLEPFRRQVDWTFHGIVGMSFLRQYVLHIDPRRQTFGLSRSCTLQNGKGIPIRFTDLGLPLVDVTISGRAQMPFLIDTGLLPTPFLPMVDSRRLIGSIQERHFSQLIEEGALTPVTGTTTLLTLRGVESGKIGHSAEITVGQVMTSNIFFRQSKSNILGLAFWCRYRTIFDFPNQMLWVLPNTAEDCHGAPR